MENNELSSRKGATVIDSRMFLPGASLLESRPAALSQQDLERVAELVHEIRTPLTALRGYSRMILQEQPGPLNGAQREYVSIILANVNQIIQLVNRLEQVIQSEP